MGDESGPYCAALTAAFVTRTTVLERGVNILNPVVFAFLLIGRGLHSSTFRLNLSAFCGIGVHLGVT